jgi:hypothetical protein
MIDRIHQAGYPIERQTDDKNATSKTYSYGSIFILFKLLLNWPFGTVFAVLYILSLLIILTSDLFFHLSFL